MKLAAAAAASTRQDPGDDESGESTEQLHHPDLGWSPKWERVTTREAFRDAMQQWSERLELRDEGECVVVILDGRMIHLQRVRD